MYQYNLLIPLQANLKRTDPYYIVCGYFRIYVYIKYTNYISLYDNYKFSKKFWDELKYMYTINVCDKIYTSLKSNYISCNDIYIIENTLKELSSNLSIHIKDANYNSYPTAYLFGTYSPPHLSIKLNFYEENILNYETLCKSEENNIKLKDFQFSGMYCTNSKSFRKHTIIRDTTEKYLNFYEKCYKTISFLYNILLKSIIYCSLVVSLPFVVLLLIKYIVKFINFIS